MEVKEYVENPIDGNGDKRGSAGNGGHGREISRGYYKEPVDCSL